MTACFCGSLAIVWRDRAKKRRTGRRLSPASFKVLNTLLVGLGYPRKRPDVLGIFIDRRDYFTDPMAHEFDCLGERFVSLR